MFDSFSALKCPFRPPCPTVSLANRIGCGLQQKDCGQVQDLHDLRAGAQMARSLSKSAQESVPPLPKKKEGGHFPVMVSLWTAKPQEGYPSPQKNTTPQKVPLKTHTKKRCCCRVYASHAEDIPQTMVGNPIKMVAVSLVFTLKNSTSQRMHQLARFQPATQNQAGDQSGRVLWHVRLPPPPLKRRETKSKSNSSTNCLQNGTPSAPV